LRRRRQRRRTRTTSRTTRASAPTASTTTATGSSIAIRVGYQFRRWVGLVAEPAVGFYRHVQTEPSSMTVRVGGDVLGQGRYAVPVGLSLQALFGGAASTWMFNGAPPESTALLNVALDVGFDMFR
jgi:hypothetical protein